MTKRTKEYLGGLPYVLGATIVGFLCHDTRPMSYLEEITFDAWVQSHPARPDQAIELIKIGDEAYRTKFCSTSPLDPTEVGAIIRKVYHGGAKAIGVDIDTTEWKRGQFDDALRGVNPDRVVWAVFKTLPPEAPPDFRPGYAAVAPASAHNMDDRNETGIIRSLPIDYSKTFAGQLRAVLEGKSALNKQNYLAKEGSKPSEKEGAYFRFVQRAADGKEPIFASMPMERLPDDENNLPSSWGSFFEGKAVLIGGTAEALRDLHETPFGMESGLEIQAEQLQSVRDRTFPLKPIGRYSTAALDFLIGAAFLALTVVFPHRTAWLLLCSLPALAWFSLKVFEASWVFISFIAVFLGLLLHSFMDFYSHTKKHERETAADLRRYADRELRVGRLLFREQIRRLLRRT